MNSDLFLGTAHYYRNYRPAYPKELIDEIGTYFELDGTERLFDLGCGTGELGGQLLSQFEEVTFVDVDEEMLCEARVRIAGSKFSSKVRFLHESADSLSPQWAPIRLATFGASLHWMDSLKITSTLKQVIEPRGGVAIIGTTSLWSSKAPWSSRVLDVITKYLGQERRAGSGVFKAGQDHRSVLTRAGWTDIVEMSTLTTLNWEPEDYLGYLLSTSYASPVVLGEQLAPFRREMLDTLNDLKSSTGLIEDFEFYSVFCRQI